MKKLRWGVMGVAKIARDWLVPAILASEYAELTGIASRNHERAKKYADSLAGMASPPVAFGSYEEMLASDVIDAVYIPLPNHMHVPWSIRALEAGKHVLCEKPLGLNKAEAIRLQGVASRYPGLLVMEAFMYRFHPQWARIRALIEAGELGQIRHVQASFTYNNKDPDNVRNMAGIGGGGLMDIGCYCISAARHVFGREPVRVVGRLDRDPVFRTDRHASGLLDFGQGMASFHCSTQSEPSQMLRIIGDKGTLFVETPFVGPANTPSRLVHGQGGIKKDIVIEYHDQYVLQVDAFCRAALNHLAAPTPLDDALANMTVIDAIFSSAREKNWVDID